MKITSIDHLEELAAKHVLVGLFDLPMDLYHQGPGVSSSGLKELLRSPAHFAHFMATERDSLALRNGRVLHAAVLEPEKFALEYITAPPRPDVDGRTREGKIANAVHADQLAAFEAFAVGKNIVSATERNLANSICAAIGSNQMASRVLRGEGVSEISVYWRDDETGVLCKARADRLMDGVIADLKTCRDAQFRDFQRSVMNYKYHLSAAFYTDGFSKILEKDHRFCWVAIETQRPHGIAFYGADQALIDIGRLEYRAALRAYGEHIKGRDPAKVLPSYPQSFVNLSLPNWYEANA